ncbi:GNAT family N-acetyltransferase [Oryzobacter telluris]|uniref:GNAT family N-acetyltransferase n=1 Tax=Oryzobacter telluris TaxID=3149179 RepID=UPI00370D064C
MTGQSYPDCVPELSDGVVLLRAHRPGDVDRIVEQCSDPETTRWTTVPRPYSPGEAKAWLALIEESWLDDDGERFWVVTDADDPDGTYLGTIDLRPRGGGAAETGFGLHPEGRGRGLMAGALRLVSRWWFTERAGVRVHWSATRGNFASWRVAWACGFTHHGTVPQLVADADEPLSPARDQWRASLGADDVMEPRAPWDDPPFLTSDDAGGIIMRPWRDEDVSALEPRDQPAHHMPARGVLDADTFPEWLTTRRERMSQGLVMSWCVADADSDVALGEVLVFVTEGTLDDDTAELGYQVLPSARRRGVATAAATALARHALLPTSVGGMGFRRLVAQTAEDNAGSNRVLDTVGFTIWGRETAADVLPDGAAVDALHWELLAE